MYRPKRGVIYIQLIKDGQHNYISQKRNETYGVEAAKRDLAHIIKISRKEHQSAPCNKNVRVIKNSGPNNSMMNSCRGHRCLFAYGENLKKYALGPFSLPRPHIYICMWHLFVRVYTTCSLNLFFLSQSYTAHYSAVLFTVSRLYIPIDTR